jgi:hypothetical protein
MPYCENCGIILNPGAKFCGNCGYALNVAQVVPPPPPPMQHSQSFNSSNQAGTEQVLGFIIAQYVKRFGNWDYYTGVLTSQRVIFVPLTKNMLKEVSEISRQQAKAKVSSAPMVYPYQQSYLSMPPSAIISGNPGCLVIDNSGVLEISLAVVGSIGDGYSDTSEYELKIKSVQGNYMFRLTKREEYVARLRLVCQDKLRLL